MPTLTCCFRVHAPYRLKGYTAGSIGSTDDYFSLADNEAIINLLADECYLRANKIVETAIKKQEGKCRLAYSISGTTIELLQEYRPDVLASFQRLVDTGCVELMAETFYNSLSWLHSKKEFQRQVKQHTALIEKVFGVTPVVLRNTELIYNNELAKFAAGMGYKGMLCEGLDKILKGRSPNQIYASPGNEGLGLLLRNVNLSDDIAFRFDDVQWSEHPLTADKYASWVHSHTEGGNINLFMDYETFGIHKKAACGILGFLEELPAAIIANDSWHFTTPGELLEAGCATGIYDVPQTISWKDKDIACCVWCENSMQNNMLKKIYSIEKMLEKNGCEDAWKWWGHLQSADHFYYMSDTGRAANDAYGAFNPFASAVTAYENYLNIVTDFEIRLIRSGLQKAKTDHYHIHHSTLY